MNLPATSREIFIQSAAAALGENFFTLPPMLPISTGMHSPDPLTDVALRLAESLLSMLPESQRSDIGLILGTTFGCLAADHEFDRSRRNDNRFASPAAFARTLPSTLASELSVKLGIHGPVLTLSAGAHSTALSFHRAVSWMHHFNLAYCLAGAADLEENAPVVALFLLSRNKQNQLATLSTASFIPAKLDHPKDFSLHAVIAWICKPAALTFALNFQLTPAQRADQ